MSYLTELSNQLKTYLHADKQREKFVFQTVPQIGCGAYLIQSSKFLAPDIFSR